MIDVTLNELIGTLQYFREQTPSGGAAEICIANVKAGAPWLIGSVELGSNGGKPVIVLVPDGWFVHKAV